MIFIAVAKKKKKLGKNCMPTIGKQYNKFLIMDHEAI